MSCGGRRTRTDPVSAWARIKFKLPSATSDANSAFGPRLTIESGLSRHSNFNSLGVRLDKIVGDPTTLADLQDVGKLQDSVVADHWLRSRLVDWLTGPIEDQELLFDENGLGDNGTDAAQTQVSAS
jgi:hypothetical protein